MKVANISINVDTFEVTVEFSTAFEREDWRFKSDALTEALKQLFDENDTVLRREIRE